MSTFLFSNIHISAVEFYGLTFDEYKGLEVGRVKQEYYIFKCFEKVSFATQSISDCEMIIRKDFKKPVELK